MPVRPCETASLRVTMDSARFTGAKKVHVHVTFGPHYSSTAILTIKAKSEDSPR